MADEARVRSRRRRRVSLALAVLLGGGALGLTLQLRDDELQEHGLRLLAPVPAADNGFPEISALIARGYTTPDKAFEEADAWFPSEPYPRAALEPTLKANAAIMQALGAVVRRRRLQATVADDATLSVLSELAQQLGHAATITALDGRQGEAVELAFTAILTGEALTADARDLNEWFQARLIQGFGFSALCRVLNLTRLDDEALAAIDRRLAVLGRPPSFPEIVRGTYLRALEEIEKLDDATMGKAFEYDLLQRRREPAFELATPFLRQLFYKPRATRNMLGRLGQLQSRFLEGASTGEPPALMECDRLDRLLSGNATGWAVAERTSLSAEGLEGLLRRQSRHKLSLEILRAVVALHRFHRAHGARPAKLEELCPRFLKSLPLDFDGRPVRYVPEVGGVYSIKADDYGAYSTSAGYFYSTLGYQFFPREKP